jgi:hypothetical protein
VTEYKNQEKRRRKLNPADESAETRTGIDHRLHSLQQPASRHHRDRQETRREKTSSGQS